jgi:ABC-type Na+ efflux pump permease subunit
MKKIALIAGREFLAAVSSRGFVIGILLVPLLLVVGTFLLPRLTTARGGPLRGEVAVIDRTGLVIEDLRATMAPEAIARRRGEAAARALAAADPALRNSAAQAGAGVALGSSPTLEIVPWPDVDLQAAKAWLLEPPADNRPRHLALVVVHADAVTVAEGRGERGAYDLYVPANTDERVESTIFDGVREALLTARARAGGLDRETVDAMIRVVRPTSITVGIDAEQRTNLGFTRMVPFMFGMLLVMGIIIGGQALLTSTVEEKSSRVVEVLLSAVSPLELMAGKVIGQLLVSLLVMLIYVAAGLMLLTSFALVGLLDPMLVVYLFVFFLVSFLLYASVFGAVGAAVNEIREAQSLMTPIMLVLMTPWMLASAIARDPTSTLSVVMSFLPPVNLFSMLMRLASATPPPAWQVWLSVLIGIGAAWCVIWVSAKIFKVGLLMHGKPPSLGTLVRWVRQA